MSLAVVGVLMIVALVLGVIGNCWWSSHDDSSEEGLDISDLVAPLTTLAVVLLAFIMVEAISSYGGAGEDIGIEARVVNEMGDNATRIENPAINITFQQDLICYARAIDNVEWKPMANGNRSSQVSVWTAEIRHQLHDLQKAGGGDVTNRLIDLDGRRSEARLARLNEARPSIPAGLNLLIYGSVIISVFGLAFFVRSKGNRGVYLGVLAAFVVVLGASLYMISDLDSPFSGINKLQPTEMRRIQSSMEKTYDHPVPGIPLPCNADGIKV